jgi:hypothetical protein
MKNLHINWYVLIIKLFLAYFAVYLGFTYGYHLLAPEPVKYREYSFVEENATILLRPIMELFFHGKIGHFYNWDHIKSEEINSNYLPVKVRSSQNDSIDFEHSLSLYGTYLNLFGIQEAVMLEPKYYEETWSIVICSEQEDKCYKSNVLHQGPVKLLIYDDMKVWGLTENGRFIEIKVLGYIDRNKYRSLVFI